MAALNAKSLIFDTVFSSQAIIPATRSSQASDQAPWDRSWRTVAEALTLPSIANDARHDAFKLITTNGSSDRVFDDALKDLLNHELRLPQASETPGVILWYTNHVRRHYLKQIFPIIQKLQIPNSTHPASPELSVKSCLQTLQRAYKLYHEGLGRLIKPIKDARTIVRNFRLNLSTVVSNSIPDRHFIKIVVKKHVTEILDHSEAEDCFLGLVRSLNDVGLGGEKYVLGLL